jgi:formate hydrogenlyase subunit 3/multisubunit Na+/H+ antiporter MnhD subunit
LTSSYLLVMYKKIFFGKISPRFEKLRDVNKYAIIPMAFMASLTLFFGVYPDPIINPIISYSETLFSESPEIVSIPTVTNLKNTLLSSGIILQDEYERFIDGDYRDNQLKQVKSIEIMENR